MTALAPYLPRGTLNREEQPILDADGLFLRPWAAADAAVVLKAYSEPGISRYNRRSMSTEDEAVEWTRRWGVRWQEETGANWAVCAGDGRVVGRAALSRINLYEGDGELGYWMLSAERGKSVAPRAVQALKSWAFGTVGLKRLQLSHSVRNEASCRVARKTGFDLEGTKRSALRHADGWHDMHLHAVVRPQRSTST
ncbi:GNAT family N-acetyltransferase [Arthrobacter zhaoxinii]|uniref:GNAT family N-acetyltransferase n=1 Tax=Arthrobacter zhaoxinii TaxID=2964616 RepID=UPI00210367BC|nr:GNAT family N-acetyltransferase [Arthrobacter zhaoxinii]MCQ2001288.1 GNAT family N-acetyltransferase [Arthrobacter zhaoxinii]